MLWPSALKCQATLCTDACSTGWPQLQPLVGNEAPDFVAEAVFDQEFQTISLSQYRVGVVSQGQHACAARGALADLRMLLLLQGKYVVLFFYPLDFTFVCPTEITAFSDRHAEFAKLNCEVRACRLCSLHIASPTHVDGSHRCLQVLGVSVDSPFSHLAWCQTGVHPAVKPARVPRQYLLSHGWVQTARRVALGTWPTPSCPT